ncbi:hypothetical protein D9613_012801 [Agrocybe pediades]|uniref:Nephrocystin 3-like N-terminal domain-containing protein n=1 Tax=Agrocybe pediades TaxID=84607 RepID=A0A8H4R2N7_9AGAR|nr:hypothetical protein D9613_012801 [Agrocybe pediades]
MANPGRPVPPYANISHSILHNPTFIQHNHNIDQRLYIRSGERPGYARLLENVATAALHDSVHVLDPPKCHPNTRVAIIQEIRDWTLGIDDKLRGMPIFWLKGGAGAGKSAIARSVAERCSEEGLLLGAFFFGTADPTRNHVEKLVATLSYQISIILPEFRDTVATFIEDDPLIFGRSIRTQFSTLVVRPLSVVLANRPEASTATPRLIIIDGLDECRSIDSQRDLVFTLQQVTSTTANILFLVCSRPESHINNTFSLSDMAPIIYKIFLDNDYAASQDIRVYLQDKFNKIKEGHVFRHMLPDPWPTPGMVYDLVDKSSGQFIYAATVVRYIDSPRHRPDQRLNAIFNLRPPFKDLPFTELDSLYQFIISKAEDLQTVLDILAFPALYEDFTVRDIEAILDLEQGSVEVLLLDLHSIITFPPWKDVRFLHKSLADFLSEPQRAGDLYQDLSRKRLSHVSDQKHWVQAHHCQLMDHFSKSWSIIFGLGQILSDAREPNNIKADYISSDILQATQQLPMFEFLRPLLSHSQANRWQWQISDLAFTSSYFYYLYYMKDACVSTRLVYWEQMRRYCECVLAVLDNDLAGNWNANFTFAYCHLLQDPHCCVPRNLSCVHLKSDLKGMNVGDFGDTILSAIGPFERDGPYPFSDDIAKICHDLIGGVKKEAIFAMSASFCLAFLCDEWRAGQDAGHIYILARRDRRKKREHPWHWRQTVPRPPSLGNRLVLISLRDHGRMNSDAVRLTRIHKVLRMLSSIHYRYGSIVIIPMQEYLKVKSEPVQKWWHTGPMQHERPQQWPLFIFLLDLLPYILPLAGRYEPLVDMCRKRCFSSLSQVWPKKSRRARQAITSYLRRVDGQEGGE